MVVCGKVQTPKTDYRRNPHGDTDPSPQWKSKPLESLFFQDILDWLLFACPTSFRKSHYVSNKYFHTILLYVWHHRSWHVNQLWDRGLLPSTGQPQNKPQWSRPPGAHGLVPCTIPSIWMRAKANDLLQTKTIQQKWHILSRVRDTSMRSGVPLAHSLLLSSSLWWKPVIVLWGTRSGPHNKELRAACRQQPAATEALSPWAYVELNLPNTNVSKLRSGHAPSWTFIWDHCPDQHLDCSNTLEETLR